MSEHLSPLRRVFSRVRGPVQLLGDHGAELVWFLRDKTRIPKTSDGGVIVDVGSGHSPHFRAHILIEKYSEDSSHRLGQPARRRNRCQFLVWGDIERLPLKDKSVSYIIASHVLEHLPRPGVALTELTRAAHAGYVECPARWSEILFPYAMHLWYVSQRDGRLVFEPKLNNRDRRLETVFLPALQFNRHVRYLFRDRSFWTERLYWSEQCQFEVAGEAESSHPIDSGSVLSGTNVAILAASGLISRALGAVVRPSRVSDEDVLRVLGCPTCKGDLRGFDSLLICDKCQKGYRHHDRTVDFQDPVQINQLR